MIFQIGCLWIHAYSPYTPFFLPNRRLLRIVALGTIMEGPCRYPKVTTDLEPNLPPHSDVHLGNRVLLTLAANLMLRVGGSKGVAVRVYIARHGETQQNRGGIIQGQRDTSLNAIGLEQARMVGEALKDAKLGVAFSSDLERAVKVRNINHHPFVWMNDESVSDPPFCRSRYASRGLADGYSPGRPLRRYSFITQGSAYTSG